MDSTDTVLGLCHHTCSVIRFRLSLYVNMSLFFSLSCNYKRSAIELWMPLLILYQISVIILVLSLVLGYRCKKSVIVLLNTWIALSGIESNLSLQWWRRGRLSTLSTLHIAQLSKAHIEQLAMHTPQCTLDTSSSGGREGTHGCFLMCIFNNSQFIFHSAYLTEQNID